MARQTASGQKQDYAALCNSLGIAYRCLGQYQRAIEYQEQSLAIQREIGDRKGEANSLYNKALSLKELNHRTDALQCFQQALIIYADLKLDHCVEDCTTQIAQCQDH